MMMREITAAGLQTVSQLAIDIWASAHLAPRIGMFLDREINVGDDPRGDDGGQARGRETFSRPATSWLEAAGEHAAAEWHAWLSESNAHCGRLNCRAWNPGIAR